MADNGGLQRAFEAWQLYTRTTEYGGSRNKQLPGLDYTAEQMFYISFAQIWCHTPDKSADGLDDLKLSQDVHSPDAFRVNGVVSNSAQFQKTFGCKPKQKMNPEEKCVIW